MSRFIGLRFNKAQNQPLKSEGHLNWQSEGEKLFTKLQISLLKSKFDKSPICFPKQTKITISHLDLFFYSCQSSGLVEMCSLPAKTAESNETTTKLK